MKAIILAAGRGKRLGKRAAGRPKSLLEFGGKSLLERHIDILRANHVYAHYPCHRLSGRTDTGASAKATRPG